jgi:beta-glucosidase
MFSREREPSCNSLRDRTEGTRGHAQLRISENIGRKAATFCADSNNRTNVFDFILRSGCRPGYLPFSTTLEGHMSRPKRTSLLLASAACAAILSAHPTLAGKNPVAGARAVKLVGAMSLDEKMGLLSSDFPMVMPKRPADAVIGAGYTPGIERLGIPSLRMTDASLGVSNMLNMRKDDVATALPSALALASSWNPPLAEQAGAMIGGEARAKRFNVMLAGGVNLIREPRNGRNFEYPSEDPLLAGIIGGAQIAGVQRAGIISTVKHFALNAQETGRNVLDVRIGEAEARESDLLAFQIAIERGRPGSVMSAYNKVNGHYSSENDWLLNTVLKKDWGYPGWVMSDWGNVHSGAKAALAGLDQQSGKMLDKQPWFVGPLRHAVDKGEVPVARIDDMAIRIVRSMAAAGLLDRPDEPAKAIDFAGNAKVAQAVAEQGIVLLKNEGGLLPISAGAKRIAVIGGHADIGVLSGGGSTQVRPVGGPALELRPDTKGPAANFTRVTYTPSPPLAALRARYPNAEIAFRDGADVTAAAEAARNADLAIVFAEEWRTEAEDRPTLHLPGNQDAVIAAVAAANPRTIVVLETGGAVLMPWLELVPAVVQAWYPGQRGGEAIAAILSGDAAPGGRLPISFPASEAQLARPVLDGLALTEAELAKGKKANYGLSDLPPFNVDYSIDGANVGYKWFAVKGEKPLFPFGYGLTYTSFRYDGLTASGGKTVKASVRVTNIGPRAGVAVPQFYATVPVRGQQVPRLIGWERVTLVPGETRTVSVTADPRLLASYDSSAPGWRIAKGDVKVSVGAHAGDEQQARAVRLSGGTLKP